MINPLITAVMVTGATGSRRQLARVAMECFRRQTYANKELVIVNHGEASLGYDDGDFVREYRLPRAPLGHMRNQAVHVARGEYIIPWDDDDWYHADRIAYQFGQLQARGKQALALRRYTTVDITTGVGFVRSCRHFQCGGCCGTMLFEKGRHVYPPLERKEDAELARLFKAAGQFSVADNPPLLYIRTWHGDNTSPRGPVLSTKSGRRPLTQHESKTLVGILKDFATLGGLKIPGVTD